MKRIDSFFLLIILIVAILSGAYAYVTYSKTYVENNHELLAKYERQKELLVLRKELISLQKKETTQKRNIASAQSEVEAPFKKRDISKTAASELQIQSAEDHFKLARQLCHQLQQFECLNQIDLLVTQFPETIWAGESLLILVEIYTQSNESKKANEIVKLMRHQFPHYKTLQAKLDYIENKL